MPQATPLWKLPRGEAYRIRKARRQARKETPVPPSPSPSPDDEIYGLARSEIDAHLSAIEEARQAKDDGAMANASAWKGAKKAGLPVDPLKQCLRLERMAESKRRDWLRGFDAMRRYFGWDDQFDMFEAARPAVESGEAEAEPESSAAPAEDVPEPAAPAPDQEGIKALIDQAMGKAKDDAAPAPETDPEADHAGTAFNQGRMAALAGQTGEQNPYKRTTLRGRVWAQGHTKGVAERAAKQFEGEAGSNVVALTGPAPAASAQPGAA